MKDSALSGDQAHHHSSLEHKIRRRERSSRVNFQIRRCCTFAVIQEFQIYCIEGHEQTMLLLLLLLLV